MSDFNIFVVQSLSAVSGFLMTEPSIYFVGLALLACVGRIFHRLIGGGRG